MTHQQITQLLETDFITLKFLLKRRLTNVHEIKAKEQQILSTIFTALRSIKQIEQFLIRDAGKKSTSKNSFSSRRRNLVVQILRSLVHHFCQNIRRGREIAEESAYLTEEMDNLHSLCKKTITTKIQQQQLLKTLTDYLRMLR